MQKHKWLTEESLQIDLKRRQVKSKGEKERYKHLNAEFQRLASRYKKFPQGTVQRNSGKQQNGKNERSLQENQRYQGNISCKDEHNKGQKWYGPNRRRRY